MQGRGAGSTTRKGRPAEKIRVVICDDHEQFRRGIAEMGELVDAVREAAHAGAEPGETA